MARIVRNPKLDSRSARARLAPRHAPYWVTLSEGRALGYRKGTNAASWLAKYRGDDGARFQKVLGPADDAFDANETAVLSYAMAQKLARDWFGRLDANAGKRPLPYSVSKALDDYLAAFTGKSLEKTKWAVERYIRPKMGSEEVAKLTSERLQTFLHALAEEPATFRANKKGERKLRPAAAGSQRARRSTANRIYAVLKSALNRAYRAGKVADDAAWRKVKPFGRVDAPRVQYLTSAEARKLVEAADDYFRPLIQAALLTGARWSELCRMRVRDVDLRAGTIHLPETKGGRPRHVHLSDEGLMLLRDVCEGKPLSDHVFTNQHGRTYGTSHQIRPMRDACERAGIEPIGFHILRHTYGSRLAMAGVSMAVIAEALGHVDERITRKHYAHMSPSYVRDAVRNGLGTMGIVGGNRSAA